MAAERPRPPSAERRAPVNKWAIAVAVAVALAFFYVVRLAVLPFLVAAAIAYVAAPLVERIRRGWRLPRTVAAVIVFLAIMGVFAAVTAWAYLALEQDVGAALNDVPQLLRKFLAQLFGGQSFSLLGRHFDAGSLAQQMSNSLFGAIGDPKQWIYAAVLGFAGVTAVILVVVLIYYFLAAGGELAAGALWLVPPEYRDEVADVARRIDPMLRRYIGGLFIIVIFATTVSWLVIALVLKLPFASLLALLTGLLELIPVLGPVLSAALVGLLSLEQHGAWAVVAFAVYVTLFRLAIDRVLGPVVLGRAARLHPTVVIFVFLAGGLFLGVPGVILAVPVAASVKIVLDYYYSHPMRGQRN